MSLTKEVISLRVGTWNVLSFDDEYNVEYGCPLSISFCSSDTTTTVTDATSDTTKNCTKERYERIWNVLEEQSDQYDIICLQEVSDEFLALQSSSPSSLQDSAVNTSIIPISNWTILHRNEECVLLVSNTTSFEIITSYHISTIPNLSGCTALPMVVLQQTAEEDTAPISYLVGSVHVQASVTNMTMWYQTTVNAILNTTYDEVMNYNNNSSNSSNTSDFDWLQYPVFIVLGGDFNHNITATLNENNNITDISEIEQPPTNWTLVSPYANSELVIRGTTQKEYNYMGMYDGFLISTTSMMLYTPSSSGLPSVTTNDNETSLLWQCNVTNTQVYMKGFMPKVVYGFPQGSNRTIQSTAQFALVTTDQNNTTINTGSDRTSTMLNWNNITFWNSTMVQEYYSNNTNDTKSALFSDDVKLLFSPSSNFTSMNNATVITIVPYSHPIDEVLSDHLFVSASLTVTAVSSSSDDKNNMIKNNSTNNNNTTTTISNGNEPTIDTTTSKSNAFLSQLTPFGRTCVYIGIILVVLFVVRCLWKYCCGGRRNASSSSRQSELDRLSMTDTPPQIQ